MAYIKELSDIRPKPITVMIDLPLEAIAYVNSQADKLLSSVAPDTKYGQKRRQGSSSDSHRPTKHTFTDKNSLGAKTFGLRDGFGKDTAIYFEHQNKLFGFEGDTFSAFKQFAEKLADRKEVQSLMGSDYLEKVFFEWISGRFKNEISTLITFYMFLTDKAKADISNREVLAPLDYIAIVQPFNIGPVSVDFFKSEFFDSLFETYKNGKDDEHFKKYCEDLRGRLQGSVYFKYNALSDQESAKEIALLNMEKALTILRYLSPTAFLPQIPSYFSLRGKRKVPQTEIFVGAQELQSIDEKSDFRYLIDQEQLKIFQISNLAALAQLFWKEVPSRFELVLLNGFYTFARGITSSVFHDKLVFNLVTLELLLLKDSSEPIQKSLDYRLSFLVGKSIEQRKEIIDVIKNSYAARSSYLHHGKIKVELDLLTKCQHLTWQALQSGLKAVDKYSTQQDFIKNLDDQILSG